MIEVRRLVCVGTSCPSQWTAETLFGEEVYIRYRWGRIEVYVGGNEVYIAKCGRDYDGSMDTNEMGRVLKKVIKEIR